MSTCGSTEAHAQVAKVADLVHHAGDVQQRLGRDAAHVQAHATEGGVALDDDGLQAQVGGAEGGRIAARAGAQHQHVALEVGDRRSSCPLSSGSSHRLPVPQGRSCGSRCGGCCRCGRGGPGGLQRQHHRALVDLVAQLDLQLLHHAGVAEGISIEALSDSTVIRLCSTFTVSPGLTSISMTADVLEVADVRAP
jgi:hypothetical protein